MPMGEAIRLIPALKIMVHWNPWQQELLSTIRGFLSRILTNSRSIIYGLKGGSYHAKQTHHTPSPEKER